MNIHKHVQLKFVGDYKYSKYLNVLSANVCLLKAKGQRYVFSGKR